jgi:hypothetical protein
VSLVNYANVEPLLASSERTGSVLHCVFRCPETGKTVEASAPAGGGDGLWTTIASFVAGILQSVFGKPGSAVGAADQAAVVGAFRRVADQFTWDGQRWVARAENVPRDRAEFERRLRQEPVEDPADRKVLARILAEIAKADRELRDEERAFLTGVVDPKLYTLEELLLLPNLTTVELGATSPKSRQTMLMLGWAMALCDRDLALPEVSRLKVLATHLGIADQTSEVLRRVATGYLLQEALEHAYRSGEKDEQAYGDVRAFADMAGVSAQELSLTEQDVVARAQA